MSLLEDPMHPGEVLKELYLDPMDMGAIALARKLNVPRTRVERLIKGAVGVTPDTALRLGHVFSTSPEYWMNMQLRYDMVQAVEAVDLSKVTPLDTFMHPGA
jgi:antitoxin HigA-1